MATVVIDNATNAGLLAAQILSVADAELRLRLQEYKTAMADKVIIKAERLASGS